METVGQRHEDDGFASRTALLLGEEAVARLARAHVLVVGLGGVGGYAAEQLCRAGVGKLTLVDSDVVSLSNINRQIIATHSNVGRLKVDLFKERFGDINPMCEVLTVGEFMRDEKMVDLLEAESYDYVVDAIDTLSPKVFLLYHAYKMGLSIVSSMGSAGKLDPTAVHISDISKSHTCPLAAMVRKRLHRMGVEKGIKVVFSDEKVIMEAVVDDPQQNKRTTIGTVSYLPPVFGCCCASVVVRDLTNKE